MPLQLRIRYEVAQLLTRMDVELSVDMLAVRANRVLRYEEVLGNGDHGAAARDKLHDLGFA